MATPGWYPDPSGQQQMFRYWDGQSWSQQTTSDPSSPPPGPGGPPPAPPTQVSPGQYGDQAPYQQQYPQYGQQDPYAQPQPGQYGGGYGGQDPYGQQAYPGGSGGGAGKRIALIALAVVLIAGLAVGGFFGVRALTDDDDDTASASDESSETTEATDDTESPTDETESPTESPTDSPTDSPTAPTGDECTGGLPSIGGETTRRGRISGGGLVLPPVSGYQPVESQLLTTFTFADEVASVYRLIEEGWIAMYAVGGLPKANGYSDLAASADQVITCMTESPNFYRNFTERNDLERQEIEVHGHSAYSVTTELRIDDPQVSVQGDVARVIVVDTGDDEHFGLYVSVVPIGNQQLIDQQESVTQELKVDD